MAYFYNGSGVWLDYVDCSDKGGVGFSVDNSWVGQWNNGGGNNINGLNGMRALHYNVAARVVTSAFEAPKHL